MANELAVLNGSNFPAFGEDAFPLTPEELMEEMDGDTVDLPVIKMPSGGAITFEIPGDDPENPDVTKELKGVIVYHHKSNAYWEGSDPVEGQMPDCVSYDGVRGQKGLCEVCPLNQFGSGEGGKGKACKNSERLYIVTETSVLPWVLSVSPASLKAYRTYKTAQVTKGRKVCDVVTTITLKKMVNGAGQPYAEVVFKCAGKLDEETKKLARAKREEVKALVSAQTMTAAQVVEKTVTDAGFEEVTDMSF